MQNTTYRQKPAQSNATMERHGYVALVQKMTKNNMRLFNAGPTAHEKRNNKTEIQQ